MENKGLLYHVMNYGLITGLVIIAYSLFLYFIGQALNQTLGYLALVIMAACIYIFTKQYRDKVNNGLLSFKRGFTIGILTGLFAAILLSFFSYIEFTFIDPSLVDKQLEIVQQKMFEKGMNEDQIEQALEISKKFMTPGMMFFISIFSMTFWAAIISLITAAILKKEDFTKADIA